MQIVTAINMTEETERELRKIAVALFGADAAAEPIGDLTTNVLPELIQDVLNSNSMIGTLCSNLEQSTSTGQEVPDETSEPRLSDVEIRAEVEAVASVVDAPNVSVPLEVDDSPLAEVPEDKPPTLEEILKGPDANQVFIGAIEWAKGNPAKEQALADTLWALPHSLWGMKKVKELAERTFNLPTMDGG